MSISNSKLSIKEVREIILAFKALDLNSYPVDEIKKLLNSLRYFPIMETTFGVSNVIYRSRMNEKDSFNCIEQLTYKPQNYNTTYMRASTPRQTMFYGAIIPEGNRNGEINSERIIAACEGSTLLRVKENIEGEEVISFGKWRVMKPLRVITIVKTLPEQNFNNYSRFICKRFNDFALMHEDYAIQMIMINDFFASEFSKPVTKDCDYILSAMLIEHFLEKGFDGVIYPSVQTDSKGLNLAILPEFIDNGGLILEGVLECKVYRKGMTAYVDNLKLGWTKDNSNTFELEIITNPDETVGEEEIRRLLSNE